MNCERCQGTELCPDDYHVNQRIKWWFDEREGAVIDDIATKQELSRQAVLRQALRTYQLIVGGSYELREVNPMPKYPPTEYRESMWFVESRINGKFDGWWTGVSKGTGGWITTNPEEAAQYTRENAELVAVTLDYFPAPFSYSHWEATEHVLINEPLEREI